MSGRTIYFSGCDTKSAPKPGVYETFYIVDKVYEAVLTSFFLVGNAFTKAYIYFYKKVNNLAENQPEPFQCCQCTLKYSTIGIVFSFMMLSFYAFIISFFNIVVNKNLDEEDIHIILPLLCMVTTLPLLSALGMLVVKEREVTFPIMLNHLTKIIPCLTSRNPHQEPENPGIFMGLNSPGVYMGPTVESSEVYTGPTVSSSGFCLGPTPVEISKIYMGPTTIERSGIYMGPTPVESSGEDMQPTPVKSLGIYKGPTVGSSGFCLGPTPVEISGIYMGPTTIESPRIYMGPTPVESSGEDMQPTPAESVGIYKGPTVEGLGVYMGPASQLVSSSTNRMVSREQEVSGTPA